VLWVAGIAILLVTIFQRVRIGGSAPRLPRPTRGQMGTVLAWVIIAIVAYVAILEHQGR
jgi:hypothetical protein